MLSALFTTAIVNVGCGRESLNLCETEHLASHHRADGFLPVRSLSGVDASGKLWHDIVFFRVTSRSQAPEGRGEGMGYIEREAAGSV